MPPLLLIDFCFCFFGFLYLFLKIRVTEGKTDTKKESKKKLPSTSSLPRCPYGPSLGQVKAKKLFQIFRKCGRDSNIWAILPCFSQSSVRELDQKCVVARPQSTTQIKCQYHKQQPSLLHQHAGPLLLILVKCHSFTCGLIALALALPTWLDQNYNLKNSFLKNL